MNFDHDAKSILLSQILPSKLITEKIIQSQKYKQILRTIKHVGLVEPLVVHPQNNNQYLMLDGHLRLSALTELGETEATCLLSNDDEAFTYNKRISRLSTVQEYYMVRKALDRGVPEEKLAQILGINISRVRQKKHLLKGICKEVEETLKTQQSVGGTIGVLRNMKPIRQIETVELMATANNFSSSYARALLAATHNDQLINPKNTKKIPGFSEDDRARMVKETESLHRDMRNVQEDYGMNVVKLVVANGYINRLLNNEDIGRYLSQNHQELFLQIQALTETLAREQGLAAP